MADVLSAEQRHRNMSRIRGRDTTPERTVRSVLHRLGYRFRLHRRDLPGRPDIVLPRFGSVIFVHGCFWHRHLGCRYTTTPSTRSEFWQNKFQQNVARDKRNEADLRKAGWRVLCVWECQTRETEVLARQLRHFLGARQSGAA
jgi:DNA mismatch endonuclease (patch repair protein)